jgi:hypothetical protein
MSHSTNQGVIFDGISRKPVEAAFDGSLQSSDGGALLVAGLDRRLGVSAALAACVSDGRQQSKVVHDVASLVRQRVYGLAQGYADCNDHDALRHDPALKLCCGRSPSRDAALACQATLSRFENGVSPRELVEMARALEDLVIQRLRRRHAGAKQITIDLDPTHDRTHGQQAFSFFNGHYRSWGYLPLLGFLSVDGDPEQYAFLARLRHGLARDGQGSRRMLRRVIGKLRRAFPRVRILVRMDAGFNDPRLLDLLDDLRVKYVLAYQSNKILKRWASRYLPLMRKNSARAERTVRMFTHKRYAAGTWPRERRMIMKVEVLAYEGRATKDNVRFVVTNLRHAPKKVYEIYCARGDAENRIKELKNDLEIDRTSCSSFVANQFRVLLTLAAYVLMQDMRWHLRGTKLARAQVGRLRLLLLKVGAWIRESRRRITFTLPSAHPYQVPWKRVARAAGAAGG